MARSVLYLHYQPRRKRCAIYMLYWYKSTRTDPARRITEANVAYALRVLPLVLIPSLPRLLTSALVAP